MLDESRTRGDDPTGFSNRRWKALPKRFTGFVANLIGERLIGDDNARDADLLEGGDDFRPWHFVSHASRRPPLRAVQMQWHDAFAKTADCVCDRVTALSKVMDVKMESENHFALLALNRGVEAVNEGDRMVHRLQNLVFFVTQQLNRHHDARFT